MESVEKLSRSIGIRKACQSLGIPRSSVYSSRRKVKVRPKLKIYPRALAAEERSKVRETLNSPRFQDQAPREVYANLLDEGRYLCSWRTMYRILAENQEVKERRDQLRHPNYVKPELLATKPNQLCR